MKILVTGGAGFIGANFVYHMLDKYQDYDIEMCIRDRFTGNKSIRKK